MTRHRDHNKLSGVYAALSTKAQRMTRQRRRIIAEFAGMRRYVTARELHKRLAATSPRIGLATVYRTLEILNAVGGAAAAGHPRGERAYLFCPIAHHHHAVCTRCGRVDDVPCKSVDQFRRALAGTLRFTLTKHQLEFFGLCARCM